MEKIQPILQAMIRQIFWILFGFALIFLLWGWFSANSSLSALIEQESAAVKKATTSSGMNRAGTPNRVWEQTAIKENDQHDVAYQQSADQLYLQQKAVRTYPKQVQGILGDEVFNGKINDASERQRYAKLYPNYLKSIFKVIKPFQNGEGLVDISSLQVTQANFSAVRPPSIEIWHAQEDIWLLRSVLEAIAKVNANADRIDKAPLRSISQLLFRGGDPEAKPGASSAAGAFGGMGAPGMGEPGMGEGNMGMGGFGGGATANGTGTGSQAWAAFEGSLGGDLLSEEYGPDPGAGAAAGGGYAFGGGEGSMSTTGGFSNAGTSAQPENGSDTRYVHKPSKTPGEGRPYKTRAFVLHAKVVQTEIPRLLAELTNAQFPIEIVRVDASFPESNAAAQAMTGGMGEGEGEGEGTGMGSSMMGSPGMGAPGMGAPGMGAPGMGAPGMGAPGMGAPGMGMGDYGGATNGAGLGGNGLLDIDPNADPRKVTDGNRVRAAALADPAVATVRVAGLMTIYMNLAEQEASENAEDAAATEEASAGDAPPATDTDSEDMSVDTEEVDKDGNPVEKDSTTQPDESKEGAPPSDTTPSSDAVGLEAPDDPAGSEATHNGNQADPEGSGTAEDSTN